MPNITVEPTYTIQGTDGQHYGPASLENLKSWIREGRITAATQIFRSDLNAWHPASSYSELGLAAPPVVTMVNPTTTTAGTAAAIPAASAVNIAELEKRIKSGAGWFYWIAAFSVVNSVAAVTGGSFGFVLGLSLTQLIAAMAKGADAIGLAVGIVAAGFLVVLGIFANKKMTWAFLVGILLYGLDTALTVFFAIVEGAMWLGVAIHVWALICLIAGMRANLKYHQLLRT